MMLALGTGVEIGEGMFQDWFKDAAVAVLVVASAVAAIFLALFVSISFASATNSVNPRVVYAYLNDTVSIVFLDAPCTAMPDEHKRGRAAIITVTHPISGRTLDGCWSEYDAEHVFLVDSEGDSGLVPKDGGPGRSAKPGV